MVHFTLWIVVVPVLRQFDARRAEEWHRKKAAEVNAAGIVADDTRERFHQIFLFSRL